MQPQYKIAESVLVVIHAGPQHVLLLRRADMHSWQSVTGSKATTDEPFAQTAAREVQEETGLRVDAPDCVLSDAHWEHHYPIYPRYLHRYAPGTTHNTERVFDLRLPQPGDIQLSAREHTAWSWLPWQHAYEQVFSASNAWAIQRLFASSAND